jgi:hypothetical protein
MAGGGRFYASNAARQRAYRRRKQEEEQRDARLTAAYASVIQAAVGQARRAGDALATAVDHEEAFATLRALADHFYDRAGTPPEKRPWLDR